jgi:hypothetical protein
MKAKLKKQVDENIFRGHPEGISPMPNRDRYLNYGALQFLTLNAVLAGLELSLHVDQTPFLQTFYRAQMEEHKADADFVGLAACLTLLDEHFFLREIPLPAKYRDGGSKGVFRFSNAVEVRGKNISFAGYLEKFMSFEKIYNTEQRERFSLLSKLMEQFCTEFLAELEKRASGGDVLAVFDLSSEALRYRSTLLVNALAEKVQSIPDPDNQTMKFGLEFLKVALSGEDVQSTLGTFVSTILEQIEGALPVGKRHLVSVVRKLCLEE